MEMKKEQKNGREKGAKAPGTSVKLNVGTIVASAVAVAALACMVFMLLAGDGVGKAKSAVSTKEIQAARALANAGNSDESVEVVNLEEDIVVTPSGAASKEASKEKPEDTKDTDSKNTAADSGYILPDSGTRYLTDADVSGLSKSDLRLARNEIMARHGRIFDSADLKEYFESKSWYSGTVSPEEFDANLKSRLSDVEIANIDMIKKYE